MFRLRSCARIDVAKMLLAMNAMWVAPLAFSFPPHVPTTTRATRIAHASLRLSIGDEEAFDINAAVTALNAAVEAEDYAEAARLKALIADQTPAASSWPQDDTLPTWLLERLEGLSFRYPTPVQSAAMKCARDAVISAPTGAGKTVAFLTPLLCKAATALEERSRATSEAVEQFALSPTDALSALAPALSTGTPTVDRGMLGSGSLLGGVPLRGSPLVLVVVPRDALAEQVAGVAYTMLGGYARATRTWTPGSNDSLFKFKGPKGARVSILRANSDTATFRRATEDCDVLVCTPAALASLAAAEAEWRERDDTRTVYDALVGMAVDEVRGC